jgi:hypothetical protein
MANVILGFGQHHVDLTREWMAGLGDELVERATSKDTVDEIVRDHVKRAGETALSSCMIKHVSVREVLYLSHYEGHAVIVVEGTWNHIRTDHPLSPDGAAAMYLPFCLTVCLSETWGTRVHISV